MFRILLGFAYVLYILIKSSRSSSVLASFNGTCSETILCPSPLICSNITHRCTCSKPASVWNDDANDCFFCPPGWISWENNHCLSFAVPSQGGLPYNQANQTCLTFTAQLLNVDTGGEFEQFEGKINTLRQSTFASAATLFFRLGAWIDKSQIDGLDEHWCDANDLDPTLECVFIRKNPRRNDSLCVSRLKCDEEMPFICDMTAISERYAIGNDDAGSGNHRFIEMLAELAPVALNLLGSLFGGGSQPPPQQQQQQQPPQQPQQPQQIIIQQDPAPAAQAASGDNTFLIIGLIIGGFLLLLLICGCAGVLIYYLGCMQNPSSANPRTSTESTASYA